LELFLDIPEHAGLQSVNSDPEIFQKIISHLLSNAIKFTEKGSIKFGYTTHEEELVFFVKDTGIGIGKESIEIVFDNFVKEDRGSLVITEGSGLGLPISKGLIELLGGKLIVESEVGIGSCFTFSIPQIMNIPAESTNGEEKQKEYRKTNTILVAEDDYANFYFLQTLLKQNTSAKIIHALNGKEAVDKCSQNPEIGLVLMDIKMPVIDGIEATRQIRAINSKIPIVAITAYAMSGDAVRILEAGFDYFLPKPIDKDLLLAIISEFIIL
jgi:CheY-like chemotaxis protein